MRFIQSLFKKKPKIIVICGPTATGKTALSIDIAKKFNGEIISADSRQVYIGLDIGSAKITQKEMQNIPHHMIDLVSPKKIFTVQEFVKQGTKKIQDIIANKKIPIICGGTGMYIDSLIYQTEFPNVPPNHELRVRLAHKTKEELYQLLQKKDSRRAKNIDSQNPARLIRALEIVEALGKVPRAKSKSPYRVLYIGLDLSKNFLNERIKKRIIDRFENEDMLQEAIDLHKNGLSYKRMEELGLEYRYMALYLQKKISYEEMIKELSNKTIQFAKRQRTWFKRNKNIHWFHPLQDTKKIFSFTQNFLKK